MMHQLEKENYVKLHFVLGVVNDKELEGILSLMPKKATYYFCKPSIPRGLEAHALQKEALNQGLKGKVYGSVSEAYGTALNNADSDDLIYVGGSTFVVAELEL